MLGTKFFSHAKKLFAKDTSQHFYPNWDQARGLLRMNGFKQRRPDETFESEYITITIELFLEPDSLVEFWVKKGNQEEADTTLKIVNQILNKPVIKSNASQLQNFIRKAKNNSRNA